jgi:hypothetical protein
VPCNNASNNASNNSNGSNAAASGAAPPPRFAPLRLRRLALVGTRVCALRGPAWRALTSELTSLTLTNCDLRPRPMLVQRDYQVVADVLASARGLRELRLRGADTRPRLDAEFLRGALAAGAPPRLAALELCPAPHLSDGGAALLLAAAGRALDALRLGGARLLGDAPLLALPAACPRLRSLCLAGARGVTDAGVLALAAAGDLEALDISGVSVFYGATIQALAVHCPRLAVLRMRGLHAAAAALAPPPQPADGATALAYALMAARQDAGRGGGAPLAVAYEWPPSARVLRDAPAHGLSVLRPGKTAVSLAAAAAASAGSCSACGLPLRDPRDLDDHALVCAHAVVACPLAADGCAARLPRRLVGAHLERCAAWVVVCGAPACGEVVPRSAAAAHAAAHAARREALAAARHCPLAAAGCTWRGGGGGAEPGAHLATCAAAAYACASCGAGAARARTAACGAAGCAAEARRRCARWRVVVRALVLPLSRVSARDRG